MYMTSWAISSSLIVLCPVRRQLGRVGREDAPSAAAFLALIEDVIVERAPLRKVLWRGLMEPGPSTDERPSSFEKVNRRQVNLRRLLGARAGQVCSQSASRASEFAAKGALSSSGRRSPRFPRVSRASTRSRST